MTDGGGATVSERDDSNLDVSSIAAEDCSLSSDSAGFFATFGGALGGDELLFLPNPIPEPKSYQPIF